MHNQAITFVTPSGKTQSGSLSFDSSTSTLLFTPDDTTQAPTSLSLTFDPSNGGADALGAAMDAGSLALSFGDNNVVLLKNGVALIATAPDPQDGGSSGTGGNGGNPPADSYGTVLDGSAAAPGFFAKIGVNADMSAGTSSFTSINSGGVADWTVSIGPDGITFTAHRSA